MSHSSAEPDKIDSPPGPTSPPAAPYHRRGLKLPAIFVALFWITYAFMGFVNVSMFPRFLMRSGALMILLAAFGGWWLVRGPVRISYRFLLAGWALGIAIGTSLLMHPSVLAPAVIVLALPVLVTAWTLWLIVSRSTSETTRVTVMSVIGFLVWIPGTLVRMEGLRGDGGSDFHWRWSPSAEERFLAQKPGPVPVTATDASIQPVAAEPGDWVGFRGDQRDGTVAGIKVATRQPPRLVWKRRVGPAWSSMVVVDGRLVTQEQRGEREVVSCFDADTGEPIWLHEDPGRYEESMGGVGPRATPAFSDGRIYALGAAGRLNCLDAGTGKKVWSHDIRQDASASVPSWGYSGSPLVADQRVYVFGGGTEKQALFGLDARSGEILWTAAAGTESYSSPHWMVLDGQPQVLFIGDRHVGSYDPVSGKMLWQYGNPQSLGRPVIQPRRVDDSRILISFIPDQGVTRIDVRRQGDSWNVREDWTTRDIKPDYSDFVHHDGYVYGFDGDIFCCLDLVTGNRQWKGGRYGAGQVVLLSSQPVLIVVTEQGEIVLVATNPQRHEEIARFSGIEGKTWNHPAIWRGRLYLRNAEEMACFQLTPYDAL